MFGWFKKKDRKEKLEEKYKAYDKEVKTHETVILDLRQKRDRLSEILSNKTHTTQ